MGYEASLSLRLPLRGRRGILTEPYIAVLKKFPNFVL